MYSVIPSLRFADLAADFSFYVDTLGFELVRASTADAVGPGRVHISDCAGNRLSFWAARPAS